MARSRTRVSVLIPDGEGTWALRVMRCLAAGGPVLCHVVSTWAGDIARFSRHCQSYLVRPEGMAESDLVELLRRRAQEVGADVILPTAVRGIRFCSQHADALRQSASLPPLAPPDAVTAANDKGLVAATMAAHGVPQPETMVIETHHANTSAFEAFPFPALVKPRMAAGGYGIRRVETVEQLLQQRDCFSGDHILQSFVDGDDVTCSMIADNGEILALTTQRALVRSSRPYAPPVGVTVEPIPSAEATGRCFAASLRWSGPVCINMREDHDGVARIIDVNPRFWGSMPASAAAGVSFPMIACLAAMGQPIDRVTAQRVRFMSSRAVAQQAFRFLTGRDAVLPTSIRHTWGWMILRDPVPNLVGRGRQLLRLPHHPPPF